MDPLLRLYGIQVSPGFTPRPSLSERDWPEIVLHARVSPGFTPRPSLSGADRLRVPDERPGVAGVHAPAFVERASGATNRQHARQVSPGFTPRPSLSAVQGAGVCPSGHRVSPGFTPRPSLSDGPAHHRPRAPRGRVAGVHAPAFVERGPNRDGLPTCRSCRRGSRPGLR